MRLEHHATFGGLPPGQSNHNLTLTTHEEHDDPNEENPEPRAHRARRARGGPAARRVNAATRQITGDFVARIVEAEAGAPA